MSTNFWSDSYIESLKPQEKLLYIYLFTNESSTLSGVYQIKKSRMIDDTGLQENILLDYLDKFTNDNKIKYQDNWICVKNTLKNQVLNNFKIGIGIARELEKVPLFIKDFIDTNSLCIAYQYLIYRYSISISKSNSKGISESNSISKALKIYENLGIDVSGIEYRNIKQTDKQAPEKQFNAFGYFLDIFEIKQGKKYVSSNEQKEAPLCHKIFQKIGESDYKKAIENFHESNDKFIIENGFNVIAFNTKINALLIDKKENKPEKEYC